MRVGWEPDQTHAIALLQNGEVHKWDWTRDTLVSYTQTRKTPTSLAIRRDAQGLLIGYSDGTLLLLHPRTLTRMALWKSLHKSAIQSIHWSYDGSLFATASQTGAVQVWRFESRAQTHVLLATFRAPDGYKAMHVRFYPKDSKLAVGFTAGAIAFWNRYSGEWKFFKTEHQTSLLAWQKRLSN